MPKISSKLVLASALFAATASGKNAISPPPPCSASEYRQFDFLLGDWEVRGRQGNQLLGTDRYERSANGCWLQEHWHSAQGGEGTSLSSWDTNYRVWRQYWSGGDGTVLRIEGGLQDGTMTMRGVLPGKTRGEQWQRLVWTPNADGSVTQQWETSDDAGKSWQVSFLGIYRHPAGH